MDNNIEIWRDIQGYEGLYQVSNQHGWKCHNMIFKVDNNTKK